MANPNDNNASKMYVIKPVAYPLLPTARTNDPNMGGITKPPNAPNPPTQPDAPPTAWGT